MDYSPGHTPSFDFEFIGKQKGSYQCEYCGTELHDHETFIREGKTYCGCCWWA